MAYQSWSVVFGEQPSAAKWNILGTNDASFADGTGINDGAVRSEKLTSTVAARAYRNAAQSITAGGAVKVLFDTESYDTGSDFDTANSRFVAPITGYYQVNATIGYSDVDADGQALVFIYVNGASYAVATTYSPLSSGDPRTTISDLVYVASGQYIEIYTQCSTTESLAVGSPISCYMSVYLVGAA